MRNEEIAAIKARVVRFTPADEVVTPALGAMTFDARALLDEVEALRAFVRIIASTPRFSVESAGLATESNRLPLAITIYSDHDIVQQARDLLDEDN